MLLIGLITVIVGLLYISESQPEDVSLQREKLKLDKDLYLNLRKTK